MLLASFYEDWDQFDATWRWTCQNLQRSDKLLSWEWIDGEVTDRNNATDGDLLVGWALLRAGRLLQRPAYTAAGLEIGQAIQEKLIFRFDGLDLLLPGEYHASEGGSPLLNLSYLVAPALRDYAHADPAGAWVRLLDDGVEMLRRNRFAQGLPADWTRLAPSLQPTGYGGKSPRFSYDACRIPLYIGWALNDPVDLIRPCVDFWSSTNEPQAIYDFSTGNASDKANVGIHGIHQFARYLVTGETPHFKDLNSEPHKYYAGALLMLAQAAYEIRLEQAPFPRVNRANI